MTEPVVGMNFETYKSLTSKLRFYDRHDIEQLGQNYKRYHSAKAAPGAEEEFTQLRMNNRESSHAEIFGVFGGLLYTGATDNYNDKKIMADIKYTRIIGQTSYAVDKNGNGKVDKGEIFPIDYCCTISNSDEKKYGLNNTTKTPFLEPKCKSEDF